MKKLSLIAILVLISSLALASETFVNRSTEPVDTDHALLTRSLTEDFLHVKTHQGKEYLLASHQTVTGSSSWYVLITTPATPTIHFSWSASSDVASHVHFSEEPNAHGGTAYAIRNKNRNSSLTTSMTIASGPTYTSAGTLLSEHSLIGAKKEGGLTRSEEWILKPSTEYLFTFTATTATAAETDFEFRWFEY